MILFEFMLILLIFVGAFFLFRSLVRVIDRHNAVAPIERAKEAVKTVDTAAVNALRDIEKLEDHLKKLREYQATLDKPDCCMGGPREVEPQDTKCDSKCECKKD